MDVTLDTGNSEGKIVGTMTCYYSELGENTPTWSTVSVEANVGTDYRIRPTLIDFGLVDHEQTLAREVRLRPDLLADAKILRVESNHQWVSGRQLPSSAGDKDLRVAVSLRVTSAWQNGPVRGTVRLHTNSKRSPVADILVRAFVQSVVEIEPSSIVIGSDQEGTVTREIVIKAHRRIKITDIRGVGVKLDLTSVSGQAGKHRVGVSVPQCDSQHLNSTIEIDLELTTESGTVEARTVTVPVHRLHK
jgi:hypothetical protein